MSSVSKEAEHLVWVVCLVVVVVLSLQTLVQIYSIRNLFQDFLLRDGLQDSQEAELRSVSLKDHLTRQISLVEAKADLLLAVVKEMRSQLEPTPTPVTTPKVEPRETK